MSLRKLIVAAALSVILAAGGIVVIAVVVQPASPKSTDAAKPITHGAAPIGTTAGTTPTSTGMVWVVSSHAGTNTLTKQSTTSGKVELTRALEGTGEATSIAQSGNFICVGFSGADHGGLLSCFDANTADHVTSWVTPGPVLDLNGGSDSRTFDLLVAEGAKNIALSVRFSATEAEPTVISQTDLPASSLSMVEMADRQTIYALTSSGTIVYVDGRTGHVRSSIPVAHNATRLAISNDGTSFYVAVASGAASRVDCVSVVSGKVSGSVKAKPTTSWILPTIDNARLVEFSGDAASGSIDQYRLFG